MELGLTALDEIVIIAILIAGALVFSFIVSVRNMVQISSLKTELRALKQQLHVLSTQRQSSDTREDTSTFEQTQKRTSDEQELPVVDVFPLEAAPEGTAEEGQIAQQPANDTFERKIGARWSVWLGGLALALGGIFLVSYAIESGMLSPNLRLTLAGLFGISLGLGGEYLRRKDVASGVEQTSFVSIPGLLTAACAITLFGVIFVASDYYELISDALAFALLGIVALATIYQSRLYGQSLAGLGLLGAMIVPAYSPDPGQSNGLIFAYLTLTGVAAIIVSKKPRWTFVPAMAFVSAFFWSFLQIDPIDPLNPLLPAATFLALLLATAVIWPADYRPERKRDWSDRLPQRLKPIGLFLRAPLGLSLTLSILVLVAAVFHLANETDYSFTPYALSALIITGLGALGAARRFSTIPALFGAIGAVMIASFSGIIALDGNFVVPIWRINGVDIGITLVMSLGFLACGLGFFRWRAEGDRCASYLWTAITAVIPPLLGAISFASFGTYSFDFTHFLFGASLGAIALYSADYFAKETKESSALAINTLVTLSFFAFTLSLHAISAALWTTVLIPVLGLIYFASSAFRPWRALSWMIVPALLITMGRFAWEPTIVGADRLWATPVVNQLLIGYGVAAATALIAAYLKRNSEDLALKNVLQALAALLSLLLFAVLTRHGMNDGKLSTAIPSLGEQSIYTLLTIGLSLVMMLLDRRSSSATLRYGSMLATLVSAVVVLFNHMLTLNPYFTGEMVGNWPFLNLNLVGYLMPAAGFALITHYSNGLRPKLYVRAMSAIAALLAFAWVSLEVRRFWHGSSIADWKGFTEGETYTYTVVWLVLGVALLVAGIIRQATVLRIASALLIVVATAKAFLIDMSNLEGALRALSFIGLGLVLMGIGLFYQRLMAQPAKEIVTVNDDSDHAGA